MKLRRNHKKKPLKATEEILITEEDSEEKAASPLINPFSTSQESENEPEAEVMEEKRPSARPFILTVSVSEDSIDALNQCILTLTTDKPLALVVFPTPGIKPDALLEQLTLPDHLNGEVVEASTRLVENGIYVIPPAKYVALEDQQLALVEQPDRNVSPLEAFLFTAAKIEKARSIVLLFTPWVTPYLEGLKQVRLERGMVLRLNYSHHASVDFSEAYMTLLIDGSIPAREIAERVNAFVPAISENASAGLSLQQEDIQSLENIYFALLKTTGIKCSDLDLIFILQHIQQRLNVHGQTSITAYAEYIHDKPGEVWLLARRLTLNLSGFFFERNTMQMIAQDIIPELLENKDEEIIRAWVPACASGEDALSLAILLADYGSNLPKAPQMHVVGTDTDEAILQHARRAQFAQNSMYNMPQDFKEGYFDIFQDRYSVSKPLMQQIHFAEHDLSNISPYANIHLIYFRGHLNKLKKEVQKKVLKNLHAALNPNGFLVIGQEDHIGSEVPFFTPVDRDGIVYKPVFQQKKTVAPSHTVSLFRNRDAKADNKPQVQAQDVEETPQISRLHRDLLLQIQNPVSIVVKADFSIMDQCGNVGTFISWPNNGKTANLLTAFPEEVQSDLRDAVQQAIRLQKALKSKVIAPNQQGILRAFSLHVRPIELPGDEEPVVQVMFIEPDRTRDAQPLNMNLKGQPLNNVVNKLETDLRHAKDRLNKLTRQLEEARKGTGESAEEQPKVVRKLQQQNDELKTTNKELLALNRDLVRRIEELRKRTQLIEKEHASAKEAAEAQPTQSNAPIDVDVSGPMAQQIMHITSNRHEIRTALTSIIGFADLLADRMVDADNKELAKYISKAGNRMSDSLAGLLDGELEAFEVFEPQGQVQEELATDDAESDRLLVVEDSDATRRLLSLVLSDRFECELAADASEAIEKAQKEKFKAVLMDINLGAGKSGVDVLKHLRENSKYERVPFMAVTAMASPRDESLLLRKGFNAYLAKPFQKSKLLSTLDQMLEESSTV